MIILIGLILIVVWIALCYWLFGLLTSDLIMLKNESEKSADLVRAEEDNRLLEIKKKSYARKKAHDERYAAAKSEADSL